MPLPVPASTVAIITDSANGFEILMVQRHQNLANAPGAWAFPGGRVEEQDYADTSDHFLAAQCAAVRETIEETGLCIERDALIPFAHWTTPHGPRRRFATWFFLCELPSPPEVQVDGSEIVDHVWLSPEDVLNRHRAGNMLITPPGFVTLTRLKQFSNCDLAKAEFSNNTLVHYNPRLIQTDTGRTIFYEGDGGYEDCTIDSEGPRNRITMSGNDWHYEQTV